MQYGNSVTFEFAVMHNIVNSQIIRQSELWAAYAKMAISQLRSRSALCELHSNVVETPNVVR
jgi:hypothetical protein